MTVKFDLAGQKVEAIVDTGASASLGEKHLACKLGIWKRVRKVKVRQGDASFLVGDFVLNTSFMIMYCCLVLCKCTTDTDLLDIGNRDVILTLSCLTENGFSVYT